MLKELQILGLLKNEALVYEALVKFGPCKAGHLIGKLDIHRNLVYQSLDSLVLHGYATKFIKKNVWHFQITDPHSLLSHIKQQEKILGELVKTISTYRHKATQQIMVYEGIESYRRYWIESLERVPEGTIDYVVGSTLITGWVEMMGPLHKEYTELRLQKKIIWKVIQFKITEAEIEMLRKYPDLSDYRLWPRAGDCVGNFNVIHDTVILHSALHPPRIIEIRDPSFVAIFRNYFDMMWEKSEPVTIDTLT